MKSCSSWTDAIADCALGKAPEAELAAHLRTCPPCRNALRGSRAMAGRIDEALHRSAAVEPPMYGPERVMARMHGETDTLALRPSSWWRWTAAGTTVLAASLAIVMWLQRPAPVADVAALSTWRSPTQSLLRPPVAAEWTTRDASVFDRLKRF